MRTAPDAWATSSATTPASTTSAPTFRPAWVEANDGNLVNRTDVFHRTVG